MSDFLQPYGPQPARIHCPWGFSRQEHWSGLPTPPPVDLSDPGIKPASLTSPALEGKFFTTGASWEVVRDPGTGLGSVKSGSFPSMLPPQERTRNMGIIPDPLSSMLPGPIRCVSCTSHSWDVCAVIHPHYPSPRPLTHTSDHHQGPLPAPPFPSTLVP